MPILFLHVCAPKFMKFSENMRVFSFPTVFVAFRSDVRHSVAVTIQSRQNAKIGSFRSQI